MKKRFLLMTTLVVMLLTSLVAFAGCKHEHDFSLQNTTDAYLSTSASCTAKATYYYSCECGEKGNETFEVGETLPHNFTSEVVEEKYLHTQATCASKAVYYKSCSVCGEKGSDAFEYGELGDHDFANNQACTVCNATYGLKYELNEDGESYSVVGIDNATATEIVVPKFYNKKPVTSIGEWAFANCSSLISVTIPNSVTSIGNEAFYNCSSLTNVTISDSVTSIGGYAFADCTSLTTITIPDSVTSIGKYTFYNCSSLTSITIPNSVTSIGYNAFYSCDSLTSVIIGNNVTSIGDDAFNYCTSLTSVTIGESVTSIGNGAFNWCRSLTKVNYTGTIDEWAQISFGSSSANPIYYAKSLYINDVLVTEANLTTATKISAEAFYNCSSLISVTIPNSVTSIGKSAFRYCGLTSVTIGGSVKSIGNSAFYNCDSLTSVYYMGTASEWSKISIGSYNNALKNATIYYYSETQPTESGNYWHFDTDGKTPIVWKKEN